jgi:hypothetical protein
MTAPTTLLLEEKSLHGRLPGPDEALELLRRAEEGRQAGIPGVPAEVMFEELERILAE